MIRDRGQLASAAERPSSSMFGAEMYPGVLDKAAATFHSIARFHPLVDGNKRMAWLAAAVLCELNGLEVIATNDEAFDLTMAVARGEYDDVPELARALEPLIRTV
ncbi:type II toxin-antitoxin system death-on-curing family toxin [Phytoactinopolyspora alkaliphila]|nr:type II toxin-antitoxin system death-on-curing family toxin [Phytoactinopolyspora alkaliphila]